MSSSGISEITPYPLAGFLKATFPEVEDACNMQAWGMAFKADYEASTKNLYAAYKRWCEDNAENPLSPKSFANQLSQNAERYHLEPVNNLHIGGGKRCRGYMGIYVLLSPMCRLLTGSKW